MAQRILYTYFAPTGSPVPVKERRYAAGGLITGYHKLVMIQRIGDQSVHVLHYDTYGNEVADVWQQDIDRAFEYASHKLGVRRDEWQPNYEERMAR